MERMRLQETMRTAKHDNLDAKAHPIMPAAQIGKDGMIRGFRTRYRLPVMSSFPRIAMQIILFVLSAPRRSWASMVNAFAAQMALSPLTFERQECQNPRASGLRVALPVSMAIACTVSLGNSLSQKARCASNVSRNSIVRVVKNACCVTLDMKSIRIKRLAISVHMENTVPVASCASGVKLDSK